MSLGNGAKSFEPPDASRRHAIAGRGSEPRGGLQRSVQITLAFGFALSSQ
jgi:hypothetical protein